MVLCMCVSLALFSEMSMVFADNRSDVVVNLEFDSISQ